MSEDGAVDVVQATKAQGPSRVADVVFTVGLFVAFAVAFITARAWPYGAAIFPEMVTAVGAVLAAVHLVVLLVRRPAPGPQPGTLDDEEEAVDLEYVFEHAGRRAWASCLGWLAVFFVGTYLGGVLVAAPVFTLLYLTVSGRKSVLFSVIYAVVLAAVLYLGYTVVLQLPLPEGVLF